jgi:hypothetical protein
MTMMITVGRISGTELKVRFTEEGSSETSSTCRTGGGRSEEALSRIDH